jgi:hypothetical protein
LVNDELVQRNITLLSGETCKAARESPFAPASKACLKGWNGLVQTNSGNAGVSRGPESLMEAIVDPTNMERAWKNVKANRGAPGPDGITIAEFSDWLQPRWSEIRQQFLDGTYRPGPVRRKAIDKPDGGQRLLAGTDRRLVAKRDRASDPTSHRPSPDTDLRSNVFGIEFRLSTKTLGSRSSQASTTYDSPWLPLCGRYGLVEVFRVPWIRIPKIASDHQRGTEVHPAVQAPYP